MYDADWFTCVALFYLCPAVKYLWLLNLSNHIAASQTIHLCWVHPTNDQRFVPIPKNHARRSDFRRNKSARTCLLFLSPFGAPPAGRVASVGRGGFRPRT